MMRYLFRINLQVVQKFRFGWVIGFVAFSFSIPFLGIHLEVAMASSAKSLSRLSALPVDQLSTSKIFAVCADAKVLSACSLEIFKGITQLYRPSKDEKAMREFILELVRISNQKIWSESPVTTEIDAKGNLLVRLPGRGKFKGSVRSIALQAHMDMTLKHISETDKDKLKVIFEKGIETENIQFSDPITHKTETWLRSKGGLTTLGADNGAGAAHMLMYLVTPEFDHPPLELIFTVEEESGLVGAKEFDLRVNSKVFINTDSNVAGVNKAILRSSMGGISKRISGRIDTAFTRTSNQMRIKISNLLGGHSGNDIHFSPTRINTVVLFANFIKAFVLDDPSLGIVSVRVPGGINSSIPNFLEIVMTSSKLDAAQFQKIEAWFHRTIEAFPMEIANSKHKVSVERIGETSSTVEVLTGKRLKELSHAILSMPNGLLINDPEFTDGVRSSSNLGDLIFPLQDPKLPRQNIQLGFFARASEEKEFMDTNAKIDGLFSSLITEKQVNVIGEFPAVTIDKSSWVIQQALKSCPDIFKQVDTGKGTVELSYFSKKFPHLNFLMIGTPMLGGDTIEEKLSIPGMESFQVNLMKLLTDLATNPNFSEKHMK